ncbi:MAG TPA: GNAT family protein [Thermoplasmata archaeon]|nr:GNAT family protein [Thermoplasmata archaeon]
MDVLGGRLAPIVLPLRTPRLSLRLQKPSDAPVLVRYINHPNVVAGLAIEPRRYTLSDELRFVRGNRRAARAGERLTLAITLRSTEELIGDISLGFPAGAHLRAGLGYWLAPRHWHQGYGSEAASIVCRTAFEVLKVHRVEASVFESNPRSMALLRSLGFKKEGHRREVRKLLGGWEGEVVFGLLSREFRPSRARMSASTMAR